MCYFSRVCAYVVAMGSSGAMPCVGFFLPVDRTPRVLLWTECACVSVCLSGQPYRMMCGCVTIRL